jgi:hypothetical protein
MGAADLRLDALRHLRDIPAVCRPYAGRASGHHGPEQVDAFVDASQIRGVNHQDIRLGQISQAGCVGGLTIAAQESIVVARTDQPPRSDTGIGVDQPDRGA